MMQQQLVDPIPTYRINRDRFSPGTQDMVDRWVREGQYEQVEAYVERSLNPSAPLRVVPRRGYWDRSDPEPLDLGPYTYESGKALIQAELDRTTRGNLYKEVLEWVNRREGEFLFDQLRSETSVTTLTLRGQIKQMIQLGILRRAEPYKSGAIATYYKSDDAPNLIAQEIKRIEPLFTRRRVLQYLLGTEGRYFSAKEVQDAIPGSNKTIASQLSSFKKKRLLDCVSGESGTKKYRLKKDELCSN